MINLGIGVQLHYYPIYKNPFYKKFNFRYEDFPGAEDYASRSMSIPLFPGLTNEQQLRVKVALEKVLG